MGYSTDFNGEFTVTPPLTPEQVAYLQRFNESRRMARDARIVAKFKDPLREAVGLPIGPQGGYYVGTNEGDREVYLPDDPRYNTKSPTANKNDPWSDFGQREDASVLNYSEPPAGQPGLWCQWVPSDDATIIWDGGEKFYNYVYWIQYIIKHFIQRWDRTLNGTVEWVGEDRADIGQIVVRDNVVTVKDGKITYE